MFDLFNLEEQYEKFPTIQREEVQKLLLWTQAQPHLPQITEHEALMFFHASKGSMEYAKHIIDLFYTFRTHFDEFFGDLDIETPEMQLVQKTIAAFPLEKTTPEGYTVVMAKLVDTDASNFHFTNSIKLYSMAQDMYYLERGLMSGIMFVLDLNGVTFGHIARIGLMQVKRCLTFLQEALPAHIVGLHFVNAGPIVDKLMAVINPFIKKELHEILHVHNDLVTFYNFVPRDILPADFGGAQPHSNELKEIFFQKLRQHRLDIIEYNSAHRVNEKLRPAKAKPASDIFGTEGNFKKLDFD